MDAETIRSVPIRPTRDDGQDFLVSQGDRLYPVRSVKTRRLLGVYVRDVGWAWRPAYEDEEPHVIMVQGHPVAIR